MAALNADPTAPQLWVAFDCTVGIMATCVVSLEEFDAATGVDKVVMVWFGASWDPRCKSIGPFFVKAA